jgi:hypothetical protein
MVSVLVDAQRNIFHARAGDHYTYYPDMVSVAKQAFLAPHPGDTDVVLSNAYPIDISLTFMRSKGIVPLLHAQPGASRVLVAACSEGVGYHGLFPFMHGPRFAAQRHLLRKLSHMAPTAVPGAVSRRMRRARVLPTALRFRPSTTSAPEQRNPIWLYPPGRSPGDLPARIPGVKAVYTWSEVIERICREQAGRRALKVVLYPCAPLQVLDL